MTVAEQKKHRRRELRGLLSSIEQEHLRRASAAIRTLIAAKIEGTPIISAFAALPGEPEILPESFDPNSGHRWCLPRVQGDALEFYEVKSTDDLMIGAYQISEPDPDRCPRVTIDSIDLFLIPGLGFDPGTGQRLGKGKGFYDRALAKAQPGARFVGVGLECQLGPVPDEPHDIPLHAIISERTIYQVPARRS